jgi:hypothetical protein
MDTVKIKNKHSLNEYQRHYLVQLLKAGTLVYDKSQYAPDYYPMTYTGDGDRLAESAGLAFYFDREKVAAKP